MRTSLRTIIHAAAVVLAAAALSAQAAKPAPMSKLMTSVQGVWVMTSQNGQDVAGSGQEILITITGNGYTQSVNGQVVERGTFKIDESKKPMTIDIAIKEGESAGETQFGVIQIDGNTMKCKLTDGAGTRPTDFSVAEGFVVLTMTKR